MINTILLAEAATVVTSDSNSYWWWVWICAISCFIIGFALGLFLLRSLLGNTFSVEEDNRRMLAAFKKREQAYLDNRKNASSILGQQDNDIREVRR